MKPSCESKIKTSICKKDNHINNYNNITREFSNNFFTMSNKNNERNFDRNKISRLDYQKRDKLIRKYRICQHRKIKALNENKCYKDVALELIDKFRNILNVMLEDEDGIYPKDEILDVSRELDDIIFYYYKAVGNQDSTLDESIDNKMFL